MKKQFQSAIILSIFIFTSAQAQFNFYSYYQGIYDDNIFNNTNKISDFVNSFSFGSAYNFESEFNNVQLYYEGNLSYFQTTTSKSFNTHRVGLVETHLFSIDDNPMNAGINYSIRNNQDEYEVYNFDQISAYINYRQSISETDFIIPGYVYNRNNFKNFTLFSHNEHKLFLTWISSFETQTSLMVNAEYSLKNYFEKYDFEEYLNEASQLKVKANIGQSLSETSGMNGYVVLRKNLSEGSRYLISDSLVYYEEEIFNDIYSYNGIETGLGFKHYLNENIEVSLEAKYLTRNFTSLPAVDRNGVELTSMREDNQFGFGAGIVFDLSKFVNGISLSATWNYFKNNSNDYFYKYSNQIISASLDYDF
ncbi:MAG TPA: hypothetical protein DHV28_04705 [Ignavibacteriales bacterium]|nr:hypothetical protein [Ignavibacteriales bacterium]